MGSIKDNLTKSTGNLSNVIDANHYISNQPYCIKLILLNIAHYLHMDVPLDIPTIDHLINFQKNLIEQK